MEFRYVCISRDVCLLAVLCYLARTPIAMWYPHNIHAKLVSDIVSALDSTPREENERKGELWQHHSDCFVGY